jgi:hypothetical protein
MTTQLNALAVFVGCVLASAAPAQTSPAPLNRPDSALLQRMLDAEDARASDSAGLAPLLTGLRSPDVATRRTAVRALGRIERIENLPALEPMVSDPSPLVRGEAINAVGQIARPLAPARPERTSGNSARSLRCRVSFAGSLPASRIRPSAAPSAERWDDFRIPTRAARASTESIAALLDGIPSDGALGREPWFGVIHGTDALLRRFPNLRTAPGVLRVAELPRVPSIANAAPPGDTLWSRRRMSSWPRFEAACSA